MPKGRKTYLGRLALEAEKLFNGQAIEQYAAICFRRKPESGVIETLLITTRESCRWSIPKGWMMEKKKPHQVAEREAWEEAGIKGKAKKKPLGYFTYLKTLDAGEKIPSIVQVHLIEATAIDPQFPEKGQRTIAWFPPHEAAALVREPELKGLLAKVERAVNKPPKPSKVARVPK